MLVLNVRVPGEPPRRIRLDRPVLTLGRSSTNDIPLADRALKAGALVVGPDGRPFTDDSIGMALAMRDLKRHLRETGEIESGGRGFAPADRSRFLGELDRLVRRALKGA